MNTDGDDEALELLLPVPAMVAINCGVWGLTVARAAFRCTIVVACGTDTVRKTVPPELVVVIAAAVLPFNLDLLRAAAEGCTRVTLMGVTLGFVPEVRCCMAL